MQLAFEVWVDGSMMLCLKKLPILLCLAQSARANQKRGPLFLACFVDNGDRHNLFCILCV